MVLERPFDDLMKNIARQKLMDIGTRKVIREGLRGSGDNEAMLIYK